MGTVSPLQNSAVSSLNRYKTTRELVTRVTGFRGRFLEWKRDTQIRKDSDSVFKAFSVTHAALVCVCSVSSASQHQSWELDKIHSRKNDAGSAQLPTMQQERPPPHSNTIQTLTPSLEKTLASENFLRSETESKGPRDRSSDVPYPAQRKSPCAHLRVRSQNCLFLQTDSSVHTGSAGTNSLGASGLETVMSPRSLPLFPKRPFTPRRSFVPFREAWPLPSRPRMGGQLLSCQRQC